jgi:hypothetical protein
MSPDPAADPLLGLLERKKNKMIRVVLGTKERLHPEGICPDDEGVFRKVVLDEVNDFFEQVCDIIDQLQHDRTITVNQLFLDKLDEIKDELARAHSVTQEIARSA